MFGIFPRVLLDSYKSGLPGPENVSVKFSAAKKNKMVGSMNLLADVILMHYDIDFTMLPDTETLKPNQYGQPVVKQTRVRA